MFQVRMEKQSKGRVARWNLWSGLDQVHTLEKLYGVDISLL